MTAGPAWATADWCAAFDYAAAHVDGEIARSAGWPVSPYFQFQADNQADRYKEAGASDYFISSRLLSIKAAAESAADDAMMDELAKRKAQQLISKQPGTPAVTTDSGATEMNGASSSAPEDANLANGND